MDGLEFTVRTASRLPSEFGDLEYNKLSRRFTRWDVKPIERSARSISAERDFFRRLPISATTKFEITRNPVKDSLQRLVAYVWEEFGLPTEGIVEYGSGATGYLWGELRPPGVDWLQVEINPNHIAENLRRNPGARVERGSYTDIRFRDLQMIIGLSSFDSSSHMPHIMQQVADALAPGGYFFHVQDVGPATDFIYGHLVRSGIEWSGIWVLNEPGEELKIDAVELSEGRNVPYSIHYIFRDSMSDLVRETNGLEMVANQFYISTEPSQADHDEFYTVGNYAQKKSDRPDPKREVAVFVTVARKIA